MFVSLTIAHAETVPGLQFKADLYQRDLQNNSIRGTGHAWIKTENREIWADLIEFDLATKRASASGNVHIKDGQIEVWCTHADYNMAGDDGVMDKATLISGQLVLSGQVVKRTGASTFEVEEGGYTNCNIELSTKSDVNQCVFDWKLYGKYFKLTIESYAHIEDALVYVQEIPVFYLPYLIAPVKSKRQSGLLMPGFIYSDNLGNGIRVPFFWAPAPWHDLTLTSTFYSKAGFHLGANYRYVFSSQTLGHANVFFLQRRFSADRSAPGVDDTQRSRFGGLIGEAAIDLKNRFPIGDRSYFRQIIRYASDPYYTVDYAGDLQVNADAVSLRSQLALVAPSDDLFFAAKVEHHENLLVPRDSGVDRGTVTSLPTLYFSKSNASFLDRYFSFELDTTFSNFFRPGQGFDPVPVNLNPTAAVHVDPTPEYHSGDYIRTGRRLLLEPRLVANVPAPDGVQIQSIAKLGLFLYHFDYPRPSLSARQYLDLELPVSLYLKKRFTSSLEGYETFDHVFQPRFVYSKRVLQNGDVDHPFYFTDTARNLSNTRFDILDQLTPFEYMRFELINRFRRSVAGTSERFLRFQLSEQYNLLTDPSDPRFSKRLGPIEVLGELKIWRLYSQIEGFYQIETTEKNGQSVRENSFSSLIEYQSPNGDRLSFGNRIHIDADQALTEKTVLLSFHKKLPAIFNLDGRLEYSYQRGELLGASLGMLFASKPRSCWSLNFQFGQDDLRRKFVRFIFALDLGAGSDVSQIRQ